MDNDDIKFGVNQHQFDKLLESFKPKSDKNKFPIEKLFQLVQILAILASGTWILIDYFSYKKEADQLALENQKITARLSELEIERKKQDSTQQEINLRYLDRLTQSELANKILDSSSKALNLRYAKQLTELDILNRQKDAEGKNIDNEKKTIELQYFKGRKIDYKGNVDIKKVSTGVDSFNIYKVTVSLDVINTSSVELEISFVAVQLFSSSLPTCQLNTDSMCVTTFTDPPTLYRSGGEMRWKEVHYELATIPDQNSRYEFWNNTYLRVFKFNHRRNSNGWGVGIWKPSEKASSYQTFIVKSKENKALAVSISLTLNGGIQNDDDNIYLTFTRNLLDANTTDK